MGAQGKSSARQLSSPSISSAWLGLAAIALHVFAPFMGIALYNALVAANGPAQDHAHQVRHEIVTAHAHHEHATNPSAEQAPLNPDSLCIGDCPCCSLSERPLPFLARSLIGLLPPIALIGTVSEQAPAPHVFHAGIHRQPRAPPRFT